MIARASPLPSWTARGHAKSPTHFKPSTETEPKWPFSICIATAARQSPWVGRPLNWHGQPQAQLHVAIWGPRILQSTCAIVFSLKRAIWLPILNRHFPDRRLIRPPCGNAIQLSRLSTTPDRPSWWGKPLGSSGNTRIRGNPSPYAPVCGLQHTRSRHFLLQCRWSHTGTNAKCRNVRLSAAVGVIADVTQTSV